MFNSISWELFLITVISLTGAYYFITALLLYQSEIKNWLRSAPGNTPAGDDRISTAPANDVMGSTHDSHQSTAQQQSSTNTTKSQADQIIGTVSDLLQEVKAILSVITDSNLDKVKAKSLLETLFQRYPTIKATIHQQSISSYIADASSDEFSFTLTTDEVMSWWE